jgi:GTP-binding protein Era
MNDQLDAPEGFKSGFVALAGRPNVGKSTLMNALLRQKIAIVTPRPQTTRTRQLGIITEPGHQMIFVDTPGLIREPRHKLDELMLQSAEETLADADVVLWLVDSSEPPGPEDEAIAARLKALGEGSRVILGINKLDSLRADQVLARSEAYRALLPEVDWIMFSAQTGAGLSELMGMLEQALPEGPMYYPPEQITETFLRDIAAELIREQILLQLRDEVPYGTAVQILEFRERPDDSTYISANIFVERDSHKGIIIGSKGSQLRDIGAAARKEIEALLDNNVFLELRVKVEPRWRRDERALKRLGYSSG